MNAVSVLHLEGQQSSRVAGHSTRGPHVLSVLIEQPQLGLRDVVLPGQPASQLTSGLMEVHCVYIPPSSSSSPRGRCGTGWWPRDGEGPGSGLLGAGGGDRVPPPVSGVGAQFIRLVVVMTDSPALGFLSLGG